MGTIFHLFLARRDHLKFVWVDKPLVLFELLVQGLQVDVEVGLTQAKELVIVYFLEAVWVLEVLAGVADSEVAAF